MDPREAYCPRSEWWGWHVSPVAVVRGRIEMTTKEFLAAGIRYEKGRYRDCRWCHGRGCSCCDAEAEKAYKEAFPDGPKPLATYRRDNHEEMEECRRVFGAESLRHAFGPDGDGMAEIMRKLRGDE